MTDTSTEHSSYERYRQWSIGVSFVLAPLLWLVAAIVYALDIGRNPGGDDSWVEGVIAVYGAILFIPVMLVLGAFVGERRPRLGIVLTVAGLFGAAGTIVPWTMRVVQQALVEQGADVDVWDLTEEQVMAPVVVTALVFVVTVAVMGVTLIVDGRLNVPVGVAMIGFTVLFFLAQAGGVAVAITWPLANLLMLVALAPLGARWMREGRIGPPPPA